MGVTTPAGRFPDPSVPGTDRWWEGTAWTAHTRPVQAQAARSPEAEPVP
ncbi:DUF2510 domain-containing protein [Streptomyces sp. NBC_00829]|nr:DUF2510 domain-containing protein [Streptomyces sp. NBC_00829]